MQALGGIGRNWEASVLFRRRSESQQAGLFGRRVTPGLHQESLLRVIVRNHRDSSYDQVRASYNRRVIRRGVACLDRNQIATGLHAEPIIRTIIGPIIGKSEIRKGCPGKQNHQHASHIDLLLSAFVNLFTP
jgi:hypothetical protein